MKKSWTRWTPEDDAILRKLWVSERPLKEGMHELPGRTHRAAIMRGYALGLGSRTIVRDYSPTWEAIKAAFSDKRRRSAMELAHATGASRRAVMQQLANRRGKEVRIAAYTKDGPHGHPTALWALGAGKDAPRPPRTPLSVIYKRQYQRLKEERPDLLAARNAAMRLRYAEKTGKLIRPDAAFRWMQMAPQHDTQLLEPMEHRSAGGEPRAAALFPQGGAGLLGRTTPSHATP